MKLKREKIKNDKSDTFKNRGKIIGTAIAAKIVHSFSELVIAAIIALVLGLVVIPLVCSIFLNKSIYDEMSEECCAIYDMYQDENYSAITLRVVHDDVYNLDNAIEIVFRFNGDFCNNNAIPEMSKSREDLLHFLITTDINYNKNKKYIISFDEPLDNGFIRSCELSNYMDKNHSANLQTSLVNRDGLSKLKDYEWSPEQWWIYFMHFDNWSALEENFSYVEGVCRCELDSFSGIEDANPDLWENIKFLEINYYGDDADVYEQELKELFPNTEVYICAY